MNRTIQFIAALIPIVFTACASIDDLKPTGGGRTYEVPYSTAYRIAADTLEEMEFSIKRDDPSKGEILAQTGKYWNGIFHCKGNLLGVYLAPVGTNQTRVEIQSLYVQVGADLACKDKAQQVSSEITKRLRKGSTIPSVQLEDPVPPGLIGPDPHIQRGKALFNGKAVCFGCHGSSGDINSVTDPEVTRLNPRPTDLRQPTDKSVRQLFLIIKYGIPGTGMVPIQEAAGLRDSDVRDIIAYLLTLQGQPLTTAEIYTQSFRKAGEADLAIGTICEAEAIGDFEARVYCEDRYSKRYRDLLVGRPADIPTARYQEIQESCKKRFGNDLDFLARCYRLEYGITRQKG